MRAFASLAVLALLAAAAPARADEKSAMVSGFDRIRIDGPFRVVVTTGASPRARAEGDARALDAVSLRAESGTLAVSADVNAWSDAPRERATLPVITLSTPSLRAVVVTGGGEVTIDRMEGARIDVTMTGAGVVRIGAVDAERLDVALIGTGALSLAGRAGEARFQANGAGAIDAAGLDVDRLFVTAQGATAGRFHADATAVITASGSGELVVTGAAACTVRGPAPVSCGR